MNRSLLTIGVVAACFATGAVPAGQAQPAAALDHAVRQRITSKGLGRFERGEWAVVGVELINPRDEPAEVVAGLYFEEAPLTRFSRQVWLPARARRITWIPVQPPEDGPEELRIHSFLSLHEGAGTPLRAERGSSWSGETLARAEAPVTVLLGDRDPDGGESLAKSKELAIAMRLAAGYTRYVAELTADDIPALRRGLDAVDHLVLAGNRIADSPAGLATIRIWLNSGGRMWILLDRVESRTVRLLLGDAVDVTEIDRVRLNEVQLHNRVKNQASGPRRHYDDPVELVRVIAPGADVLQEVDGWPALLRQDIGRGRVLFTTLSADAWMRPRRPHEQVEALDRNSTFIALQGLDELANFFTRPLDPPPLVPEDFEPMLSEQVGYRIPRRRTVLSVLGLFWIGLLGLGFALLRRGRLERLAIVGPLIACAAAAPLAVLGSRARHAIPPTAAVAEVVHVGPSATEIHSTGTAAVFVPEPTAPDIRALRGRLLIPRRDRLEGTARQMIWTDLDEWHWSHLTMPTGLHFAATEQHTSVATPLRAVATFGPDGLYGRLETGPYAEPSDALIAAGSQHALSVQLEASGRFSAGQGDLLEPGVYLGGALLTDEQRRRHAIYQRMLQPRLEFRYPKRPMLFAWARPTAAGLTFRSEMEHSQSSLLAVPLEIQPPPPATDVFVPSPILSFESLPTADGTATTAYDPRTGQWQKTSYPTETMLRFAVPRALLPFQPTRATLNFSIRAPMRTVELATGAVENPVRLASLEGPVGSYSLPIEALDALEIDEDGGLHVRLTVSDLHLQGSPGADRAEIDRSWKMDFLRLELYGRFAGIDLP